MSDILKYVLFDNYFMVNFINGWPKFALVLLVRYVKIKRQVALIIDGEDCGMLSAAEFIVMKYAELRLTLPRTDQLENNLQLFETFDEDSCTLCISSDVRLDKARFEVCKESFVTGDTYRFRITLPDGKGYDVQLQLIDQEVFAPQDYGY